MKQIPILLALTSVLATTLVERTTPKAAPTTQNQAASSLLPAVPTTKILAIGHLTPKANLTLLQRTMRSEVSETVKLHLAGKIDNWYMRRDKPGVVFVLNLSDLVEAKRLLDNLPLGKAGLMEFDLTPLGPLAPLGILLSPEAKHA